MDYDFNKTARWTFYTAGTILVFIGVLAISYPLIAILSTVISVGAGFLIAGANYLVPYFSMKNNPLRPKWFLPLGMLDIVFGALFITNIGLAVLAISTLLGAWMLLTGCLRLYASLAVKAAGITRWWMMTINAVLMIALSLLLLSHPDTESFFLAFLAGASLSAAGVLIIAEGRIIYPGR
jgi:uncharacterized membrane protein HdeD (DUF308 family)